MDSRPPKCKHGLEKLRRVMALGPVLLRRLSRSHKASARNVTAPVHAYVLPRAVSRRRTATLEILSLKRRVALFGISSRDCFRSWLASEKYTERRVRVAGRRCSLAVRNRAQSRGDAVPREERGVGTGTRAEARRACCLLGPSQLIGDHTALTSTNVRELIGRSRVMLSSRRGQRV